MKEFSPSTEHWKKLENMYISASVNQLPPVPLIAIGDGNCEIRQEISPMYFHAGGALHGAYYFKLLDDSAYFACASRCTKRFVLTKSFKIEFIRPAESGVLHAEGKLVSEEDGNMKAVSTLHLNGKLIGKGEGSFVESRKLLNEVTHYA